MTNMATMAIYGKNPLKILFPGTSGIISIKLGMWHQGLWPIIMSKFLLWVDLDLFFGKVKFCNLCFYIKNLTVMDSLEIIAAFDLEIGCILN